MKLKISARLDLSPITASVWEKADNKSQLINEALEFYAHHGRWIQEDLKEIRLLLEELKAKGIAVSEAVVNDPASETIKEIGETEPISKEDQELQEGISSTIMHFLGGDDE